MKRIATLMACALWIVAVPARGEVDVPPVPDIDTTQRMERLLKDETDGGDAYAGSPGAESRRAPPPALAGIAGLEAGCPEGVRSGTIELAEVVSRALCTDPRTRQTWAAARAQAAQVGIERAAFLPKASASIEEGRGRVRLDEKVTITAEDGSSEESILSSRASGRYGIASLDFTWTLFDFGQRDAAVDSALQTLLAATATHDATVQTVFLEAASAYYALLAAQSSVDVAKEVEQFNLRTLADAEALAKQRDGADGNRTERLQARSSAAQATLDRSRAEGGLLEARGQLAVLIGSLPNAELLVATNDAPPPDQKFVRSVGELLEQARATHPAIRAAEARVGAARANVDAAKRLYLPSLSLVQGNRRELDELGSTRYENRLGVQLNIPIFDRARHYQKRAALAELDRAQAEVADAQQKVALEVWTAYQSLKTESTAFEHIKPLLDAAKELLQDEQDLYRTGDGDMTDLILAQQTVAEASLDRLRTLANWRAARIRLAASLGQLGFWAIREPGVTR